MNRAEVVLAIRDAVDGRHVRWRSSGGVRFDGAESTIEIYDVEPRDQLPLLKGLRPMRDRIDEAAGGRAVFVFYTASQSRQRRERLQPEILLERIPFRGRDVAVCENQTHLPRQG